MSDTEWRCPVTPCTVVYVLPNARRIEPADAARRASMALAEHLSRDHTSEEIQAWLMTTRKTKVRIA